MMKNTNFHSCLYKTRSLYIVIYFIHYILLQANVGYYMVTKCFLKGVLYYLKKKKFHDNACHQTAAKSNEIFVCNFSADYCIVTILHQNTTSSSCTSNNFSVNMALKTMMYLRTPHSVLLFKKIDKMKYLTIET